MITKIRDYKRHEQLAQRQEEKLAALQEIGKLYREMNQSIDRWRVQSFLVLWSKKEVEQSQIDRRELEKQDRIAELATTDDDIEKLTYQISQKENRRRELDLACAQSSVFQEEEKLRNRKQALLDEQKKLLQELQTLALEIKREALRLNDLCASVPAWDAEEMLTPVQEAAEAAHKAKVAENERVRKKRELDALLARDQELDTLFERLYEDNVSGKIDDARFAKMAKRYEQEQGENAGRIKTLRLEVKKLDEKRMDVDDFLETVRRYTDATKITKRMVAELIDHIEVYPAVKEDGVTNQRVTIHYNCIGVFEVPDRRKIPERDILLETRRGVALSYAPAEVAV